MNWFLIVFLILLIVEVMLCTLEKYVLQASSLGRTMKYILFQLILLQLLLGDAFYLFGLIKETSFRSVVGDMASFLIIFNYVIPISLYVTLGKKTATHHQPQSIITRVNDLFLEMQKFFGSLFFIWDEELYCPIADERPVCNSSDLNEELGQVFLFTVAIFITKVFILCGIFRFNTC